jgi:putative transposase
MLSAMTAYRRLRLPGATYFFTVCLEQRGSTILTDHIDALRWAYLTTVRDLPVSVAAMVVLPDDLHAVWTEPADRVEFSERWRLIKARFSHSVGGDFAPSSSKRRRRERGLWQRRFWEHCIRNETELQAAMEYCRWNPVKHGLVSDPAMWPYASHNRRMGRTAHPTRPNASMTQVTLFQTA